MRQYIVDAFTKEIFHGNPAAVCVMDTWISDELMQKIAVENIFEFDGITCMIQIIELHSNFYRVYMEKIM